MSKSSFSRRDFLKLTGYGLIGAFLPNLPLNFPRADDFYNVQARVIDRTVWSYDAPNLKAKRKKLYWHDLIVPLQNSTIGEDETAYNRIWYEATEGGYIYSGGVQPVHTILNVPQSIPLKGALGEISVPYTDAFESLEPTATLVYRLYYETVHWVTASAVNKADGSKWYVLLDDKFKTNYYIRAEHVRLITTEELTPLSPEIPNADKRIEVRLNDQMVLAYEKDNLVYAVRVSTGSRLNSRRYSTPNGEFITYHKRPTRHMATGDIASNGFDLPGVPWVLYITEKGISFHGTYWHNDYGRPRSHGCINMTPQAAKWLFRWTMPVVPIEKEYVYGFTGTRVDIQL
jgi:lipoprotein-anchoring transpeptidase ErfK/SrfK